MIIAKVQVNGLCAVCTCRRVIPVGLIGGVVEFEFTDPMWDGYTKHVVFRGVGTKTDILNGNIAVIPQEVIARKGVKLKVGIYGTDADKTVGIPTFWADLGVVMDAADPNGDPATDPQLPIWAQLVTMIGDLDDLDTAQKESLVAAINELASRPSGSGGGTVSTVPRDTAYTTAGTGAAYTVDIPWVTELYDGLRITIKPHVSGTTTAPTLDVNGLGSCKIIRLESRMGLTQAKLGVGLFHTVYIYSLVYSGGFWLLDGLAKPTASDLSGTVNAINGGTGRSALTSGSYLVGNGTGAVGLKTPEEVAEDIGAITQEKLQDATNEALAQAKESGEFDGADGRDGADGKDGANGKDGTSATHSWNGTVLTVTSASGTSSADLKGAKGDAGADGSDYVLTDADKAEIANEVLAALPTWTGGSY